MADIVEAVPDGTIVQLREGTANSGGFDWREVTLPDGRVGWLASRYLIRYDNYLAP